MVILNVNQSQFYWDLLWWVYFEVIPHFPVCEKVSLLKFYLILTILYYSNITVINLFFFSFLLRIWSICRAIENKILILNLFRLENSSALDNFCRIGFLNTVNCADITLYLRWPFNFSNESAISKRQHDLLANLTFSINWYFCIKGLKALISCLKCYWICSHLL